MFDLSTLNIHARILIAFSLIVLAYSVDFLCCKFLVPFFRKVALRTSVTWDNYLTGGTVLNNAFHLIPPVLFTTALPLLFPEEKWWTDLLTKGLSIYIIVIFCRLICSFISSLYAISNESEALKNKPMKGVYQMMKIIVVCLGTIVIIGVLIEKDLTTLVAGLGVFASVLMLVFKDMILGLVAGVQLSAYDMVRPGDWIMLDKYGVNGTVEDVSLNTVKIRNWDKTITTIPPYILISDSFKNWRGMRESEGRRVARSIRIDMNSIRFCTEAEIERYAGEPWAADLGLTAKTAGTAPAPRPVNLQLFRRAVEHYLRTSPLINQDLFLVVRQLEPTSEGLPLQLYFFTLNKEWVAHEHIAADIIEHVIATMPEFGIRPYQRRSDVSTSSPQA